MKKKKGNDLDFYYLSKDNKRVQKKKRHPKKKNPEPTNNDMFNIDNEIVIGVTVLPSKDKKNNKNKNKKNKNFSKKDKFDVTDTKQVKSNYSRNGQVKNKKRISYEEDKKRKQKREKRYKILKSILKILFLFAIIIGILLFLFVSPVFNIKNIEVSGNKKINTDEIKSVSKINLEENILKFSSKEIKKNIKENAYIDTVEIKRKIPNTVQINVTERKVKYQLEYGNAFAYIDENGYILEISSESSQMPIIRGYSTVKEDIKSGNKLTEEDCEKLIIVKEFLKVAEDNGIYNIITIIDISNDEDYKFELPAKGKVAYMGDSKNISSKILTLKEILTREEGKNGQIFINDSNKMPYFREKV